MIPIIEVPKSINDFLLNYQEIFSNSKLFDYISRYVTGLITSPNKTLQAIYDLQVWEGKKPCRRTMHDAVFNGNWDYNELMEHHRKVIKKEHTGADVEVITLDWTLSHHEKGKKIFGTKKLFDYVNNSYNLHQIVLTAAISNKNIIDGLDVVVQKPGYLKEEELYLQMSSEEEYASLEELRERCLELLCYLKHKNEYKKRTELALEIVKRIESEGHFPSANYAFDNGVLTFGLTEEIEKNGKQWVSEIECNRNIMWEDKWQRADKIDDDLKKDSPKSFHSLKIKLRNGEEKQFYVFSKVLKLKKYGRKRVVIVHEEQDLSDKPRFLLTSAKHWESKKIIETWSYRWTIEIFHEISKQETGFESAQVRNEEAVKRHFCLCCISQSIIQRTPATPSKSERFEFADGKLTVGQKIRTIIREILLSLISFIKNLFSSGKSCEEILEDIIPV